MSSRSSAYLIADERVVPHVPAIPLPAEDISPYAAGFEAGKIEGQARALEAVGTDRQREKRAVRNALQALGSAAEELTRQREHEVSLAVADSAAVALEIVEALVGSISERPEWWFPARLAAAMALVPDSCEPVVRISPADFACVHDLVAPDGIRLVADEGIREGGCLVEAGPTSVDAGLDSALVRLRALLSTDATEAPCSRRD